MILDTLDKLHHYASVNPLFVDVLRFLQQNDINTLPLGRHEIKGDDLFVNIQEAAARTREEARLETHKQMIDIQIPLSAPEEMGYTPLCQLDDQPYNEAKDITFYPQAAESYFTVTPGEFVIFFPQDGHAPAISPSGVKKAIFKVKAN